MSEAIEKAKIEEAVETEAEKAEVEEQEIKRPYTLRKIKNSDLWAVLGILTVILPDDLKEAFVQVMSGEKTLEQIGIATAFDMGVLMVKNAYKAQEQVDAFCADMAGITVEELNEMEFGTTPLIIYDAVAEAKNVAFFKVLSKLL